MSQDTIIRLERIAVALLTALTVAGWLVALMLVL